MRLLQTDGSFTSIARSAAVASRVSLRGARNDPGMVEAFLLLAEVTASARKRDFAAALRKLGVHVPGQPSLVTLTSAIATRLDSELRRAARTDVSEMAILAALGTLTSTVGARLPTLFEPRPEDVRHAVHQLGTEKQFGAFTRSFFANFVERFLAYHLSRELSMHVGRGRRFETIDEHSAFNAALRVHCYEAARIVEDFAGQWYKKAVWQKDLSRDRAKRFVAVALQKFEAELGRREEPGDAAH